MNTARCLLVFLFLFSVLIELHCHPPASSLDREILKGIKESCYFAVKRNSNAESHKRVESTEVSTTCSGNLKKMETLLGPTKANLFGASSRLDLGMTRSGFYSNAELDLKPFSEKLICDGHEEELVTKWATPKFAHIKRKKQGGQTIQMCSFPKFTEDSVDCPVSAKVGDWNTKYVSKEEARMFTLATGYHLHVGTPLCHEHHQLILSLIDEYKDSDMEWTPAEEKPVDTSVSTTALDLIKQAVYDLADAIGLTRYMPEMPFPKYAPDTQRKKTDVGFKMYRSVLRELAPGHEDILHDMIEKRFHPRNWDRYVEHDADGVVSIVAQEYLLAPDMRMRDFTLALLAGKYSYQFILRHIPDLSIYHYQKARKIARSGRYYPIIEDRVLERYDTEGVIELIMFITSPHVLVGLPYGERVVHTKSGKELRIPNTIRMMSQTEIVRQFTASMIARGKEKHLLSSSTIIRILKAIPAITQHSMTCVDSYLAKSYYSFQELLKFVDRLHELTIIDKKGHSGWTDDVLEGQLYLRTDYKLHVKPDSLIADHCTTFGLSDPQDPAFRKEEDHDHVEQCPRCVRLARTFKELLKLIADAVKTATLDTVKSELKEMHFKIKKHQDIIERLKYHELRTAFTQLERMRIINGLTNGQCLLTGDFAQKWLPHYYMEEQKQYYGKAGRSWHVFHSLCRLEGQFVQHAFVHLLESSVQDSVTVTSLLNHVCDELKRVGITTVFVRSDNAGIPIRIYIDSTMDLSSANYHSATTLGSIPTIMEDTGMKIDSWSFSERQNGKSSPDRIIALCKGYMLRYFETGKNVYSTHEMFEALTKGGTEAHLLGISIYEGSVIPPIPAEKNNWKLKGIQDYGHFEFETGSDGKVTGMRCWKYHGIGEGKVATGMKSNAGTLVLSHQASRAVADPSIVQDELRRLRNNEQCEFWINDVGRNTVDEVHDTDDEPDEEMVLPPPPKKPSPPDLLHYCWCGSSFIRFQNLMNHMEWGDHKICPEKVSLTDFVLDTFKRRIEDRQRTTSLLPLEDVIGDTLDASIALLTEGFALFKRAQGGALPESSRSFAVKYYEEMKAKGIRADPEEAMNKQNLAAEVPFEDRLTLEQISSLYCRIFNKKGKAKRDANEALMEEDEDEEDDSCGIGEWSQECTPPEPEQDPFLVVYKFIQDNKATLFLPS